MNNVFSYAGTWGDPAVFVGSRDYDSWYESELSAEIAMRVTLGILTLGMSELFADPNLHCNDDEHDGSPYGSAVSNSDLARHNVVMQNQIVIAPYPDFPAWTVDDMIRSADWSDNSPNYIEENVVLRSDASLSWPRPALCFVEQPNQTIVRSGQSYESLGADGCVRSSYCEDGDLVATDSEYCEIAERPFECRISRSNAWCSGRVTCPAGWRVIGAKAACNLEYGAVSDATVDALPFNRLEVVRRSSNPSDGWCQVSFDGIREGHTTLDTVRGFEALAFMCREYDRNGGECHVKGVSYCRPDRPTSPWTAVPYGSTGLTFGF